MKHTLFITGAAGYVGFMLVEQFSMRSDVEKIVALDKEAAPESFLNNPKVVYIHKNTSDEWESDVLQYSPDIIINTAWQIRDMYGQSSLQHKWNIKGTERIFDFALNNTFVKRLIDFSTVASYGAFWDNTIEHRFKETEEFRPSVYRYAEEKRAVEDYVEKAYANTKRSDLAVVVLRPAAITGPRGRFSRIRFGLQSALSGQLSGAFIYRIITFMTSFVPATPKWARQFIHEDDVVDIVELAAFSSGIHGYEVYNICPPGDPVLAPDMARTVGKFVLPMPVFLVRIAFFIFWHISRGRVPTSPGAWRGYSYPIMVDGSKISQKLGFEYSCSSKDAFAYTNGRYESVVPETLRKMNPKPTSL